MVQAKAKCTNVPVQTDARRSQQKQDAKKRKQPETTNTQKHQTNPTKQETGHANKTNQSHEGGGATNTNQDNGQRGGQTRPNKARARGEEGKRRPANKERADARECSRGRREKAAQAKKVGACSFSGVLRGFWITRGRIPQCRSEGHMYNTHNMVERVKPHTGPKPLLP